MVLRFDSEKQVFDIKEAERIEINQLKIWLNRHTKNFRFNPKFKMGLWDGKVNHFEGDTIDMGLWKECLKACNEIGHPFNIENKQDFPIDREVTLEYVTDFCTDFFKNHIVKDKKTGEENPFMPYDYQIETAFKILKNKYCLAEVATSGGKSLILSIVFFYILRHKNPDAKILVILPSISLIVQLHDNLVEYNRGFNDENDNPVELKVEEIMSDKPRKYSGTDSPNIYLATYQSLAKTSNWGRKWFAQFNVVAIDESHKAKAASLKRILERTFTYADYRVGVSGTFPEEDTSEILSIERLTGPIVTSIKAKTLQDRGKISNVKVKSILLNHDDHEFDERLKAIRKNKNLGSKAYQLEKKYIHDSANRMKFISKLIAKFKKNSLVLFNIIDHGKYMLEYLEKEHPNIEFLYIDGQVKKKDRETILESMESDSDKVKVLLATFGTLAVGVSVNNIHNVLFTDSFKSEQLIIQSIGRSLRLHETKGKAFIFDLVDCFREDKQNNSFYRHGVERKRLYKKHKYPFDELKFILT